MQRRSDGAQQSPRPTDGPRASSDVDSTTIDASAPGVPSIEPGGPPPTDPARDEFAPREASAAEALYDRVATVVNKMVWMYLANDRERDDVVQDIFVSIMRGAGSVRDAALLEAWASRVAFNTICNFLRRRKFRRWLSLENVGEEQEAEEHADFEGRELVTRARRVLESLELAERIPLTLELFGNADQAEIARLCGCSERTVRRRIKSARKHFLAVARTDPMLSLRLGDPKPEEESTDE